jgi:hypothetical protein
MCADKPDVYDSEMWVNSMNSKSKSWLINFLRTTLRSSAPSASANTGMDEIAAGIKVFMSGMENSYQADDTKYFQAVVAQQLFSIIKKNNKL